MMVKKSPPSYDGEKIHSTSYIHYFYEQFYIADLCLVLSCLNFLLTLFLFSLVELMRGEWNENIKWITSRFININFEDARGCNDLEIKENYENIEQTCWWKSSSRNACHCAIWLMEKKNIWHRCEFTSHSPH